MKKYQKIEVPIDLFRLNRDLLIPGGRNSLFQFYVRDLKLRVRVKPNAFRHTTLRMPDMPKLRKRWGRVLMQGLGHFIYATSSYWVRQDVMKEDWEYRLTWADQKRRFLFLDGPRFDSNTFQFNWTHSMAGAMYYNYARVNNLNIFESMLFTVGASSFWEFVVEFKEVVSINDMIGTPMGGPSIGEAMFQVSRVIRDKKPTILNKIAGFISNPIMTLNYWLDRKKNLPKLHTGASDLWHDFRIYYGPGSNRFSTKNSGVQMAVGVETQVMVTPEYGKPTAFAGKKNGTLFTEFNLGAVMDKKGLYQFDVFAKSVLFGYFNQDIRQDTFYDKTGYSFFLGVGTAFELSRKRTPTPEEDPEEAYNTDKICVINLLGPAFDFSFFHKDLKIRFAADVYGDFALVHSLAYFPYADMHEVTNTKSTLLNHGYYYALGFTTSSLLQVNYANLEVKGKLKYHYFDSIEGLDRFQKDMADEDDFELKDTRLSYHLSVGFVIPDSSVQLVLAMERTDREGWLEDFYREHTETRSYFQVKYLF
ncbi:MAG: DUF3943 domain-containing protein [bacterium]|nr:DUF3943 domain-containing protein [bacterium]